MKFNQSKLMLAFSLSLVLTAAGCGKNTGMVVVAGPHALPGTPAAEVAKSLDNLTTEQVLRTKYDQAAFTCKAIYGVTITANGSTQSAIGTDSFTWDLLKDYSETKDETLHPVAVTHGLTVKLHVSKISIGSTNITTSGGSYQLQYSPVLAGTYDYQGDSSIEVGQLGDDISGTGPFTAYERILADLGPSAVSAESPDHADAAKQTVDVQCTLATKIKTPYQSQFKKLN